MELLTREVQSVFRDLLSSGTPWLSNATKRLAEVKVDNIVHNIGYPDDIVRSESLEEEIAGVQSRLYSDYQRLHLLQIVYDPRQFFENVLANLRARTTREMSQLDDKVNRTLWTTTPAVVNAYYSRNRNQISN